jgi:shikimate dehydrogenase
VDGLAMFVHQGAAQFELWTGRPAPAAVMAQAAQAGLTGGSRHD